MEAGGAAAAVSASAVAAGVSFSYPAARFLILRMGLLDEHPVSLQELVALEGDVQKAVRRLETQIESLKSELEWEQEHNVATEGEANRSRAELEVQLSVSQTSERVLQQMVNQARAELSGLSRQLHDTQRALAKSQAALAAAADTEAALRTQLQQLEQKQLEQQQQQGHRQEQQQQQEQMQQQLQELKQQAEVLVSTPGKAQAPLPVEQPEPTDTAADTIRQQDQQDQRTPQPQQQRPLAPWQADTLQQGQQSPATAARHPHPDALQHTPKTRHILSLLIPPSARHIPSPLLTPSGRHIPSPLPSPSARHIPSPLLSPSPAPSALRRSGRDSPMTALVRSSGSRIPTAPEAAAGPASLSYAAALRRSQTVDGRDAAGAGGGAGAAAAAGKGAAGISSSSAEGVGGSKPPAFKFTAPALHTPAATSSTFSSVFKPFSSGKAGPITTPGRFGSSGSGSISSRSRRAVRSHGAQGTNRPKQQVLGQHSVSKLPKVATEADGGADESGEARKRRWR